MEPRKLVAAYFSLQSTSVVVWWVLLLSYPPSRNWFQPTGWPPASLLSFWLADLVLIVGGSGVAALSVWRLADWSKTAVWTVVVVTWYPTLVCIATSLQTGEAWIAASMMVIMSGLSLAMATIHGNANQSPATIRVVAMARPAAVSWTLGQTAIFWGTFLWVLPMGIIELERHLGWSGFTHAFQRQGALTLFFAASCLGLWSGVTMAARGGGTPLPTATAPRLVIAGPYRYIRNPMAAAGIAQGIAVGWGLGSIGVLIYSLTGAVLWHFVVRPTEEEDLSKRFGAAYDEYRNTTKLWIPVQSKQRIRRIQDSRNAIN